MIRKGECNAEASLSTIEAPVSLLSLCPCDEDEGDQDGCHDAGLCVTTDCGGQLLVSSCPHYLIITIIGEVRVDRVISREENYYSHGNTGHFYLVGLSVLNWK